jgi:hypothetical protein
MVVEDKLTRQKKRRVAVAEIKLGENLWKELVIVAKKNRKKPQRLAEMVLRDYLTRATDEELLARTASAAQRKRTTIPKAEAAIKERRRSLGP